MKTYHVTLQVQDILDECINQVALDFRALRVNDAAAADKYYDDYMLSTDEKDPFVEEFQSVAAELCARFPLSVRACTLTEDRFAADVTIARELPRQIMERRMKDYMKATMLAWWYRLRNPDLWQKQAEQAETAGEELRSLFAPSCTTRRLRYF